MAFPTFFSCLIPIHPLAHGFLQEPFPYHLQDKFSVPALPVLPHPRRTMSIAPNTFCCVYLVTCPSLQD